MRDSGQVGRCECCGGGFSYRLGHAGWGDDAYAYCDACGQTAFFNMWRAPEGIPLVVHKPIAPELEELLQGCACGGRFRGSASPRCPHCRNELSAVEATTWLEGNSIGTKDGWRWQRSWQGIHAIIIEERVVHDCWRAS